MGRHRKRKHTRKSDSEIREKIRKLQERLDVSYSGSDYPDSSGGESEYYALSEENVPAPAVTSVIAPTSPLQDQSQTQLPLSVPEEILAMLGEAKKVGQEYGDKIPDEISERWGKILQDGLAKDQKESLIKNMLIPEIFLLIQAPKLNPEVAAVLIESAKNRDKRLEKATAQLGSGIAGLVNLFNQLIVSDMDKKDIIKKISEVSQILLDLHYESTINRRKLILPLLDKKFYGTIQGVKRDAFLFGEKLGENIKNSKEIERSSQHIRKPLMFFQKKPITSGNSRVPPRHQSQKAVSGAANRFYSGQSAAAQRRNTYAAQLRTRAAPPPAPTLRGRQADRRNI